MRADEADSHDPHERGDDVITVHEPDGDVVTGMEVESVCDFDGLTPPDLDQFRGD